MAARFPRLHTALRLNPRVACSLIFLIRPSVDVPSALNPDVETEPFLRRAPRFGSEGPYRLVAGNYL